MALLDNAHNIAQATAPVATYSGAGMAFTLWGLHLSDFGVIVSSCAAVCGVAIQFLLYRHELHRETKPDGDTEAD